MKKLLALCLTVVLVLAMMPIIGASAAEKATFSVGDITGAPGEEVTVPVSIDANPGLTFAQVMIGYDADALEIVNVEKLTLAGKPASSGPITANPIAVTWADGLADTTETGVIANITFKIKDDAVAGDYTLEVEGVQENIFNLNYEDVAFTTVNGTITVESGAVEPPVVNGLTFIVGNVTGAPGEEVSVPVEIAGNPGITFAQVMVGYDASALEIVNVEKLTLAGKPASSGPITANPIAITWADGLADTTENGVIANIIFKIKDGASGTYTLTVEGVQENIFNLNYEDVAFTTINGTVTVGASSCEHNWVEVVDDKYLVFEATCDSKATYYKSCSLCGIASDEAFETGDFADHTWAEVVDDKYLASEATCDSKATYYKNCSVCGEVSDETFESGELAAHTWAEVADDKYLATEATCEAKATYYKSCSVCGEASDETFEAGELAAHTPTKVVDDKYLATEATCENKATYYTSCSVCGEALDATFEDGDLAEHTYGEWVVTKEATETETGLKEKECSVCGDKVEEVIPVISTEECTHEWAEVVDDQYLASAATCEAKATYYKSCSLCGEVSEETFEAGELAEHKYGEWVVTKEPTETETGLKEKECSVCGDKVTEEIPVLTPSIKEVVFAVGSVEGAPGDEVTVEVSINENPGITLAQIMVGYDADALEVVAITPVKFAGIDASYGPTSANPIKITWENNFENITETGVIATITFKIKDTAAAADYALSVSADPDFVLDTAVNNVPFAVVDGAIKVHHHNWVEVVDAKYLASEATCTAKATYYKSCSVCGKAGTETFETGDVLAHTAAQVVDAKYLATEATCIDKATYYTSCSVCGAKLDATFEAGEVDADNHAGEKTTHAAVESTCTVQGNEEYVTCDDCGVVVEGTDAKLPLAPHTWAEVVDDKYLVSEATCTAKAVYNKSCSVCGEAGTETFETGDVLAHTWAEVVDEKYLVSEATCTAKAVYNKSCSVCGEASEETFEAGELAAHDLKENAAVDATCDAEGSIANWTCSVCEKIFKDAEAKEEVKAEDLVIEKVEHKYGDWKVVTEATTVDKGSKEKVCEICGDKVVEEIPVLEAPEKPEGDAGQTSPTTSDVNIFVVASMIMALAAAAVVVLKKKA